MDISKCKVINLSETLSDDDDRNNQWRVECADVVGYNIDVEAKSKADALKKATEFIANNENYLDNKEA